MKMLGRQHDLHSDIEIHVTSMPVSLLYLPVLRIQCTLPGLLLYLKQML